MFLSSSGGDGGGRGPYDDFWYGPIPGKTSSGVRINDETAMRLAVLYSCISVISQDISKVPLVMYRRKDDGSRERVTAAEHPVVKLLQKPTRHLTAMGWKARMQAHKLLRGNGYCHIRTNFRGTVTELYPWKTDYVRVEVMRDESLRYHVRDTESGSERVYLEGEVHHQRGLSMNGPLGMSPIDQMKETLGEAVATQEYGSTFFANDARPSLWLEHPTKFQNESIRTEWLKAFKRSFGGGNRFSPLLTEYGIKVNQLPAVSHSDLQFIELRKFKNNEMCAIYRVPPHKVAILERSTNNNIEHQGIEYVTDCLSSWAKATEEEYAQDLLTESERDEFYFEFLLDALMRGDTKSRYEAYTAGVNGGWMTRNEVRKRENLDALPDLDEPLQPLNMVPAGTAAAPDTPAPADSGAPSDDLQQARSNSLELQARRRVLNRESRALTTELERAASMPAFVEAASTFYVGHLPFVMEALVLPRDQAEAYCLAQCDAITAAVEANAVKPLLARWSAEAAALKFSPLPPRKEKP